MTSYRRINSRTLNRDIRQQDNMVNFMKPISNAVYPNYFSVPDASNNSLLVSTGSEYSATASPNLVFDGTTLAVSGSVVATQFVAGQLVNIKMLSNTDLGQSTRDVSAGNIISLFSYSYTPKISNSYLVIEYQSIYFLNGSGVDTIDGYLYVTDGTGKHTQSHTYQQWQAGAGGGTRSGTMFPIVGRYTNTSVTAKSISVEVENHTDADTVEVAGDISTWLKITEIAR